MSATLAAVRTKRLQSSNVQTASADQDVFDNMRHHKSLSGTNSSIKDFGFVDSNNTDIRYQDASNKVENMYDSNTVVKVMEKVSQVTWVV